MDSFRTPDGAEAGIKAEYFADSSLEGRPLGSRTESNADVWWAGGHATAPVQDLPFDSFAARWTATLRVEESGKYRLDLDVQGAAKVFIDGRLLFATHPFDAASNWETGNAVLEMEPGREYHFKLEFLKSPAAPPMHVRLGLGLITADANIARAAALAKSCDAAVVFAGYAEGFESEAIDRKDMKLAGFQDALVAAVLKAQPRAIVVLNTGAPVEMPWADEAKAIVQAYYPGMEGGHAIANVLFGRTNPSGKLAVSYPKRLEDNPTFINFPGGREVLYGEGVFVGYRYYDKKKVEPLFPFGHGLSYTQFEYSELTLPA